MNLANPRWLFGIALAGALAISVACSSDDGNSVDDLNNGVESPINTAVPDTDDDKLPTLPAENGDSQSREEFISDANAQLSQIETRVDELEAGVATVAEDTRPDAQAKIDEIKGKVEDLQTQLVQVQMADDSDFESLKSDIEDQLATAMTDTEELADELGI